LIVKELLSLPFPLVKSPSFNDDGEKERESAKKKRKNQSNPSLLLLSLSLPFPLFAHEGRVGVSRP
jgi:hypothetical protein